MNTTTWKEAALNYSIPTATCVGSKTGPENVDGSCVQGGRYVPSGTNGYMLPAFSREAAQCAAFPVFTRNNVPYTNGTVAGHNYDVLMNLYTYTRLNMEV